MPTSTLIDTNIFEVLIPACENHDDKILDVKAKIKTYIAHHM